jgi:hypothetical protein
VGMKNKFESVHDSILYFNRVGKNVQGQENECCAAARTAEMDKYSKQQTLVI